MARDLSAIFKIANVINSSRNVQALQPELLVLISEMIPARTGGNRASAEQQWWSQAGLYLPLPKIINLLNDLKGERHVQQLDRRIDV